MLTKVRIQNYKSIRDVTVDLQQVNLLIGANNSGKTNFLKALEFFGKFLLEGIWPNPEELKRIFFNQEEIYIQGNDFNNPLAITFSNEKQIYKIEIYGYSKADTSLLCFSEFIGQVKDGKKIASDFRINEIDYVCGRFYSYNFHFHCIDFSKFNSFSNTEFVPLIEGVNSSQKLLFYKQNPDTRLREERDAFISLLSRLAKNYSDRFSISSDITYALSEIQVFKPDPNKLTDFYLIKEDDKIASDCSNLVSYLDKLKDTHSKIFSKIQKDLNKCLPEFDEITLDRKYLDKIGMQKKIGLKNKENITFWADELSEGTLYFLCLLCIIHQPNPPKLLLLEELEKGIHPVRIQEVINFIFRLTEEKDIQIIMTSHHPLVLEEFKDIPESVFIFDKTSEGSTVKNLLHDVIEVEDKKREEQGLPKTDYISSLSNHWTVGLIGGVPR